MIDKTVCIDCGAKDILNIFDKPVSEFNLCAKCLAERMQVARDNAREQWR